MFWIRVTRPGSRCEHNIRKLSQISWRTIKIYLQSEYFSNCMYVISYSRHTECPLVDLHQLETYLRSTVAENLLATLHLSLIHI